MKILPIYFSLALSVSIHSQTISDLIAQVNVDSLALTLNEFSGEVSTQVNGNTVTILNRVSNLDNNIAADYLLQKFNSYTNLNVQDINYSPGANGGRNIIATQLGQTNPDNIYIICGHYDTVADYCADDNASGVGAVLEIARILSTQCTENTIIYALWDQEEIGLVGANNYAQNAANNGDNILGVFNMDMMAHDGDGDNDFDIDVRDIANSLTMKDDVIAALNTYATPNSINLNVNVVNPGTSASDHSRFWNQGYSAILFGEAWSNNDQTEQYHTSGDRVSTLDLEYYYDMVKLAMGYMATKAILIGVTNTVTETSDTLTADQTGASYQWINCDTDTDITGETSQSFSPLENGNYAVKITLGNCTEVSNCIAFNTLSVEEFDENGVALFPNPVNSIITIKFREALETNVSVISMNGKVVLNKFVSDFENTIDLSEITSGVYIVKTTNTLGEAFYKIIKN